jgi:hypothetical protein
MPAYATTLRVDSARGLQLLKGLAPLLVDELGACYAGIGDSFNNAPGCAWALSPRSTGPPRLPEVLMNERGHLLERLLGGRRGEITQ